MAVVDASEVPAYGGITAEDEDIKLHVFKTAQAFEMLAHGVINNAVTLIALQWLQLHHGDIKKLASK
jgi:ADP-ribose pyrophosphatase